MIVDDNQEVLKSMAIWLTSEGFSTHGAKSAKEAVIIARKVSPSVALVDLRLDQTDGIRVTEQLLEVDAQLKVIILTGFPSYDSATAAMKAGAFDYLSKGTANDTILESIRNAFRERSLSQGEIQDNPEEENTISLILICRNTKIIEKIEKLSTKIRRFRIAAAFHSFDQIRTEAIDRADITFFCETCLRERLHDTARIIHDLEHLVPGTRPVVMADNLSMEEEILLLKAGMKGFCSPDWNERKLEHALMLILEGEIWASRKAVSLSLGEFIKQKADSHPDFGGREESAFGLTKRENEILAIMVKGSTNRDIAEQLHISEMTVKTHIHRIFKKMDVKSRSQAILKAMEEDSR